MASCRWDPIDTVVQEAKAPSGELTAWLVERNPGALEGISTWVIVQPATEDLAVCEENAVYSVSGGLDGSLHWRDARSLVLMNRGEGSRPVIDKDRVDGTGTSFDVVYSGRRDVNVRLPSRFGGPGVLVFGVEGGEAAPMKGHTLECVVPDGGILLVDGGPPDEVGHLAFWKGDSWMPLEWSGEEGLEYVVDLYLEPRDGLDAWGFFVGGPTDMEEARGLYEQLGVEAAKRVDDLRGDER